MSKVFLAMALAASLASLSALATNIQTDAKTSVLAFSGEHAGMTFKGKFEKWQAQLVLPPAENPSVRAQFNTATATTGDSTYDETLLEGDWFDVENHPSANFQSDSIEAKGNGFEVSGTLTIKGMSNPVTLVLEEQGKQYQAKFQIDRIAFAIGVESDPDAEWVSRMISMTLTIAKP